MDELASDPLVDTDGCAEQLFLYLWTKNRAGGSCPGVRLPDTVGTPSFRCTPEHSLYTPRVGPACYSRLRPLVASAASLVGRGFMLCCRRRESR